MIRIGLFVLLLICSCTKKTQVPKDVLPPDKMEKLLQDLIEADDLIARKSIDSTAQDSFSKEIVYTAVFNQHKVSKKEFKKSFSYYESHPELLKTVLDSIQSTTEKPIENPKTLLKNKRPL